MNAVVRLEQESRALTAADLRTQVNLVQEVMKAVMKDGTHYGVIPGTPKPSLWKPGAEVLAATFRIAVSYHVEDLSTAEVVRYRVTATGTHQTTGIVMGDGMGECSSGEEKYKWRKAVSNKEFEATPSTHRRRKFGYDKHKKQEYETLQVRTEPADLANTILKMACKRAQVAMTLNVTAASDIFTQDIEDLPEELRSEIDQETGEIKSKGLPPYPAEGMEKDLTKVGPLIQSGKKTADEIIATIKSKYTMTLAQETKFHNLTPQPERPPIDGDFVKDMEQAEGAAP